MSKKKIILVVISMIAAIIVSALYILPPSYLDIPSYLNIFGKNESASISIKGENFTFEVSITPDPPREKNNLLIIKVKDSKGIPIEKAMIEVAYEMPGMTGMPPIKREGKAEEESKGIYKVKIDLPSSGIWTLNVKVTNAKEIGSGRFTLSVGQKGLTKIGEQIGNDQKTVADEGTEYEIVVDEQRRQTMGVRTGTVIKQPMKLSIRAFGNISYNETELDDVTIRIKGWITNLKVNYQGEYVKKGQLLFTLYSPELYAAQKEYLQILKRASKRAEEVPTILKASRDRLKLFGLYDQQIDEITQKQEALEHMPFLSPADGYVIEKHVVEGDIVEAGMKIFRIVPIKNIWLKAEIYQSDLLQIHVGDKAKITLPYIPGKTFTGHASYIYPYLKGNARTGEVLFQLDNPIQELLLDMYANVEIDIDLGDRLQVPDSAVIYLGNGRLVFLDLGNGRLHPKKIKVGLRSNGYYEVISGLKEGERVVTSANFLIAAESRILSAIKYWGEEDDSK